MVLAVLLRRRVLIVFGSLGVFAYLSKLAFETFAGSLLFPFVLSGVGYQRNRAGLEAALVGSLPPGGGCCPDTGTNAGRKPGAGHSEP